MLGHGSRPTIPFQNQPFNPKSNHSPANRPSFPFKRFQSPTRSRFKEPLGDIWDAPRTASKRVVPAVYEEEIKGRSEDGKLEARWMRSRTFPAGIYGRPAHVKRVAGTWHRQISSRRGKCVSRCVSSCLYIGILNNDSRAERANHCLINIFFVLTHE